MADFTISSGDYIRPYRSPWGPLETRHLPESTGQSFKYGDVLEQDSRVSTSINCVARASTTGSTCNSTGIVGIAAANASSVQYTKVPFFSADRHNEFWARTRGGTLAATNIGAGFGLFRDATKNVWLVDLGNTQSTSIKVIVTQHLDEIGDSGGAVAFKFGRTSGADSTNTFGLGY
jgi:hypothetical protein